MFCGKIDGQEFIKELRRKCLQKSYLGLFQGRKGGQRGVAEATKTISWKIEKGGNEMSKKFVRIVCCLLIICTSLLSCFGCGQPFFTPSEKVLPTDASSRETEGVFTSSSRVENASSVSSQEEKRYPRQFLKGKEIADVKDFNDSVFILTTEKRVYFYGPYEERLREISIVEENRRQGEKGFFELILPEPIVKIEPFAAIGESGAAYILLYPPTAGWTMYAENYPDALYKVDVKEKIKSIRYGFGDFVAVTGSGKVYTIGEGTLYGENFVSFSEHKQLQIIEAAVPEEIEEAELTFYSVLLRGKSGSIYIALRHVYNGPDTHYPEFATKEFPYSRTSQRFERIDGVKAADISVYRPLSEDNHSFYMIKEDGSIAVCPVDETVQRALFPGYQSGIEPSWPEFSFSPSDFPLQGEKAARIFSNPNSEYYAIETKGGAFRFFFGEEELSFLEKPVRRLCIMKGGIAVSYKEGDCYLYGKDLDEYFLKTIAFPELRELEEVGYRPFA